MAPKPGKKGKPKASNEAVLKEICRIMVEVDEEFRNKPEYYRVITIRLIDYLLKTRPALLPDEWRGK